MIIPLYDVGKDECALLLVVVVALIGNASFPAVGNGGSQRLFARVEGSRICSIDQSLDLMLIRRSLMRR
jgi:hypothetical protein